MQPTMPPLSRWRRRLVAMVTVLIVAVVLIIVSRRRPPPPPPSRPHVLSRQAVTIVPGIHLLGGLAPAAAYVVETSEGLVLIDTGLSASDVKSEMASLGLDWRRVCGIFLTHVHHDHSGGAQELRGATGAKVYAGQGDAAVLRAGGPLEAFFGTLSIPLEGKARAALPNAPPMPVPTTVDVELKGGETTTVGDAHFRALATPGHTPGSTCYLMERGEQRVLFSGDVIISLMDSNSPSRMSGPLGTYPARAAPRYGGDAKAFLSTLRRLRALPVPQLVLPGHPRRDAVPASPAMSQQRWEALLDAGIRDMEQLQERFARDGANFLDGVPKQLLPGLYYLGEFKNVSVYGFSSASKFFVVDAPGGRGLSEFLNVRLGQLGLKPVAPTAVLLTSGNPEETAGLAELVKKHHCQVVASPGAWDTVRKACPAGTTVLAPADLPRRGWFKVEKTLPLRGCGVAPVAYLVRWAGKSVLFSGRIPIKPKPAAYDLAQALQNSDDYRASIRALAELQPDLWLPAFPTNNQNANLYDMEWENIITNNLELFRR